MDKRNLITCYYQIAFDCYIEDDDDENYQLQRCSFRKDILSQSRYDFYKLFHSQVSLNEKFSDFDTVSNNSLKAQIKNSSNLSLDSVIDEKNLKNIHSINNEKILFIHSPKSSTSDLGLSQQSLLLYDSKEYQIKSNEKTLWKRLKNSIKLHRTLSVVNCCFSPKFKNQ